MATTSALTTSAESHTLAITAEIIRQTYSTSVNTASGCAEIERKLREVMINPTLTSPSAKLEKMTDLILRIKSKPITDFSNLSQPSSESASKSANLCSQQEFIDNFSPETCDLSKLFISGKYPDLLDFLTTTTSRSNKLVDAIDELLKKIGNIIKSDFPDETKVSKIKLVLI